MTYRFFPPSSGFECTNSELLNRRDKVARSPYVNYTLKCSILIIHLDHVRMWIDQDVVRGWKEYGGADFLEVYAKVFIITARMLPEWIPSQEFGIFLELLRSATTY